MSRVLPRLRTNLEFMPSPDEERPGLLIRDPYRYSDAALIVPTALVGCLELFDGASSTLDLRAALVELTGDLRVGDVGEDLLQTLSDAGFLDDEVYARQREQSQAEFAAAAVRKPALAGSAYPEEEPELRAQLGEYLDGAGGARPALMGVAAPHVSLEGGKDCYRDAYGALGPEDASRVFVILGTSHFGEPDCFGLTRKPFLTPLGEASTDTALVDELAAQAPGAVCLEDYCHSFEHSIEFQILFLQKVLGAGVRIVPILCGAYVHSLLEGGAPESDEKIARFLDALGEIGAREGKRLCWVLGIDMAHMGRRYGDDFAAQADEGVMAEVAVRDRERIDRLAAADARGFWDLVRENRDDLKWCGASPLYTFLRACPQARAELVRYQQWNIDPESVVTFSALHFA
jgi:MEMO1 family protein